jgi:hypothetical protein
MLPYQPWAPAPPAMAAGQMYPVGRAAGAPALRPLAAVPPPPPLPRGAAAAQLGGEPLHGFAFGALPVDCPERPGSPILNVLPGSVVDLSDLAGGAGDVELPLDSDPPPAPPARRPSAGGCAEGPQHPVHILKPVRVRRGAGLAGLGPGPARRQGYSRHAGARAGAAFVLTPAGDADRAGAPGESQLLQACAC